jgi:hypothetical protein
MLNVEYHGQSAGWGMQQFIEREAVHQQRAAVRTSREGRICELCA